jgi:hypothetical protein
MEHEKLIMFAKALSIALLLLALALPGWSLNQTQYLQTVPSPSGFPIVQKKQAASLAVDSRDWPGVIRAAHDLQADVTRVTGITPALTSQEQG